MSARSMLGVVSVLLATAVGDAWSQATGTVTGVVTDAQSTAPVGAAQVFIPQLQIGSLTQANGRFLLVNVPAGTHTVQVERIGYRSESRQVTVTAGQSAEANFTMSEDALALDEIVVTGTAGQARRREVGNTITQIRPADMPEPVTNIGAMLQGRVAGARVMEGSGNSGSGVDIRLRGNVSVALSNQPLIYIDGVRAKSEPYPFNSAATGRGLGGGTDIPTPLNDLNPADIERIEIVKGPAATTLYGTEAAAGVIQIFTKSAGSVGSPVWSAELKQGFSYMRPLGPDTDYKGDVTPSTPHGARYYYMDPVMRHGYRQGYNLSVRGGAADRLGYFLSGGWEDNQGATKNDYQQQLTLRGNTQFRPHEQILIQFNNSFTTTKISQNQHGNTTSGFVMTAYRRDQGYVLYKPGEPETLQTLLRPRSYVYTDRYVNGLTLNFTPSENFTHRVTLGHDFSAYDSERSAAYCWNCSIGLTSTGSVARNTSKNVLRSFDYVGNLSLDVRSNLRSTLSFGVQGVENTEETVWATGSELPGPGDYTISSASMRDSYQTKIRVITGGLFVQDMLALSDRYFLTLGLRVDGNSAFGSGFGLQPYPKASFSYVISDEAFWPEMLGSVKLRAAYGFAGRAPGAFDAVRTWEPIGWGTDRPAFQPQNLGNEDLGPERTRELELGFDASVLSNRVNAEVTYYTRTTADALFGVRRPATSGGWDNQLENVGEFKNWGTEATVNATILNSPSLRWDLGVGITTTKSEVISLGGSPPQSNLREGLPVPVIRGSKIMNFWEKADPIVQSDQVYGPSYPTHMYNLTTSIGLPGGIALSGRGEYQGGFYISNGAESNALSRGISSPKCYNAYRLQEAGRRADMYAWERQQCFGMSPGTNIVPGDFFELRDVTLSIPLSSLVPSLTSWSSRTDLTVSARNVWYKTSKELVYGHPEQESRTGIGSPGFNLSRSIGETIPPQSFFTVSLRTVF